MAEIGQYPGAGRPWGNAFIVNTPRTDRFVQQMLVEQKQRDAIRQQQMQALDDEFAKNVANVRDIDIPEVQKAYGDYQNLYIGLMKKKGGATPEDRLNLLRAKGNMYKLINESKQLLTDEEDLRKEIMKNPDVFEDDAASILSVRRQTPLSKLRTPGIFKDAKGNPLNLLDYNTYRYKGPNFDFSNSLKDAQGLLRPVFQEEEALEGGLQSKITEYKFGNTPAQFYDKLLASLAERKAGRSAAAVVANTNPELIAQTQEAFKGIPPERWQKMGISQPQEIIITEEDTPQEVFAKHQAQLYAINNEPLKDTPKFVDNKAAIMKAQEEKERRMAALRNQMAENRIRLQQRLMQEAKAAQNAGDKEGQELALNRFINEQFNAGQELQIGDKVSDGVTIDGKTYRGKFVSMPMSVSNKYKKAAVIGGKTVNVPPDYWFMTSDKKQIIPLYSTGEKTKSGNITFGKGSRPIDITTYKADLRPTLLSIKSAADAVLDTFDDEDTDNVDVLEEITLEDLPKGAEVIQKDDGNFYYNGKRIKME